MPPKPGILVVADDPPITSAVRTSLLTHGYRVRTTESAVMAGRILFAEPIDLVVLDLDMGAGYGIGRAGTAREGTDAHGTETDGTAGVGAAGDDRAGYGTAVLAELRGHTAIPIVALGSRPTSAAVIAVLDAGADDYLSKPVALANCAPGSASCSGAPTPSRRPRNR